MNSMLFWKKPVWAPSDEAAAGDPPAPVETATPAAPELDLSFIPQDYRGDDGSVDLDRFKTDYEALLARQTQADEVGAPEAYDFNIPEDFDFGVELPEGFQVAIADDPAAKAVLDELSGMLKEYDAPQEFATGIMGLLAKYQAAQAAEHYAAVRKEAERLGPTQAAREARLNTVQRAIEGRLPAEQAKALMAATSTYEGVRALEALLAPRGPAAATPSQPSGEDLAKLPPRERLKIINARLAN